jgi:4-methylaminobutanoate oxidase (formaldehyde-forming)
VGILTGGGMGRIVAHWLMNGTPDVDVTGMNIDRLHVYQNNPKYRASRTVESLGMVYEAHYPTKTYKTARGAKKSPFYDRMAAAGAYFKDVSGWEGPDWYAKPGEKAEVEKLSWGRMNWWPHWQEEHKAAREGVIIMDMSFMSKFMVQGRDAGKALNWISANNVDGANGVITYTQWLNIEGKLEADLTVTKLGDEKYLVVVTDTMHRHAETWMKRHFPEGAHAVVTDVTSGYGQLNVQGPRSRELLQSLTSVDLSNEAFPFRTAKEIDLGFARALCIRITYLGELGYELYIPSEQAVHVYDLLVETGKKFDLKHAGLKSLASLRMEKGYRDFGHDIDNTDNPLEAGLGFAVDWNKPEGFHGKEALAKAKEAGTPHRRLLQVLCKDPEPLMYHAEVVYRNGKAVGYVRAASYGHSLGGAVGLAMVEGGEPMTPDWIKAGSWELEINGKKYPAVASLRPMFDPDMKKIKS